MPRTEAVPELAANLADNLRFLRQRRELTQARLAALARVPRATLALLETGSANPTLAVLARLSSALGVGIDELLSAPRADLEHYPRGSLPTKRRGPDGRVTVSKLLPDALPGLDFERLELAPGGRMTGVPHRPGTREYLACEVGSIVLRTDGEEVRLEPGDTVAFRGDQAHSYANPGGVAAVGYSVVVTV